MFEVPFTLPGAGPWLSQTCPYQPQKGQSQT